MPFEVDMVFETGALSAALSISGERFTTELASRVTRFDERFEERFGLREKVCVCSGLLVYGLCKTILYILSVVTFDLCQCGIHYSLFNIPYNSCQRTSFMFKFILVYHHYIHED